MVHLTKHSCSIDSAEADVEEVSDDSSDDEDSDVSSDHEMTDDTAKSTLDPATAGKKMPCCILKLPRLH